MIIACVPIISYIDAHWNLIPMGNPGHHCAPSGPAPGEPG